MKLLTTDTLVSEMGLRKCLVYVVPGKAVAVVGTADTTPVVVDEYQVSAHTEIDFTDPTGLVIPAGCKVEIY